MGGMDDAVLRVGVVGAGPWAQRVHAPGLRAHPGFRLTSVWARRPETAQALSDEHGAEPAEDFEGLLYAVDAVAFAVPPAVQGRLAPQAARAGKHLILEKPLAADVDTAQAVVDAVDDAGVTALMMLTRRFAPEVREWITELDQVGGWTGGSGRWLAGGLLGGDYAASAWRQEEGTLLDVGPHAIDLLDAALGGIEVVRGAHRDGEDLWHLMLGHAGGATSTLAMSLRIPVQPAVVEFAVYGENGHRQLVGRRTAAHECYALLLDEFLDSVRNRRTAHTCDARRGLHLQRVLAEIQRSL
jgi:predicted dehydrogenase